MGSEPGLCRNAEAATLALPFVRSSGRSALGVLRVGTECCLGSEDNLPNLVGLNGVKKKNICKRSKGDS